MFGEADGPVGVFNRTYLFYSSIDAIFLYKRRTNMANLVAVTACTTGIAHTFMAAQELERAAQEQGDTIKVETQGAVGAENRLTPDEIAGADAVIIAADTKVDLSRFAGKPIYETSTNAAINDGAAVVRNALTKAASGPAPQAGPAPEARQADYMAEVQAGKAKQKRSITGVYKHLLTGVSYMIPFVVAGGILIALGFA